MAAVIRKHDPAETAPIWPFQIEDRRVRAMPAATVDAKAYA